MNHDVKSYQKQTLECYLVIFIIIIAFFGTFIIAGQISGMNWISYVFGLAKELSFSFFTNLF